MLLPDPASAGLGLTSGKWKCWILSGWWRTAKRGLGAGGSGGGGLGGGVCSLDGMLECCCFSLKTWSAGFERGGLVLIEVFD